MVEITDKQKENFSAIVQMLEIANKNGAFSLQQSSLILKTIIELNENVFNPK